MAISQENIVVRLIFREDRASLQRAERTTRGLAGFAQNAFSVASGNLLADAVRGIGSFISSASSGVIGLAGDFEQTRFQFRQLTGDIETADQLLADLEERSLRTPFEPTVLQQGAQALLAYGIEQDKVLEGIDRLGELSGGNEQRFLALADAYGKANARFKVTNETLELFQNNGVPILDILADTLGRTREEIISLASAGQINFNTLETAIENVAGEGGRFFGSLAEQSQTLNGLLSTVSGAFNVFLRNLGQSVLPLARQVLPPLIEGLFNLIEITRPLFQAIGNRLPQVFQIVQRAVSPVVEAIGNLFVSLQRVTDSVLNFLPEGFRIEGVLIAIGNALGLVIDLFARALDFAPLRIAIAAVTSAIVQSVATLNGFIEVARTAANNFSQNWELAAIRIEQAFLRARSVIGISDEGAIADLERRAEAINATTTSLISAFEAGFNAVITPQVEEVEVNEVQITPTQTRDIQTLDLEQSQRDRDRAARERQRAEDDRLRAEAEALRRISQLRAEAIENDVEREIALRRLTFEDDINSLIGNAEQQAEQRRLLEEELQRDIIAIRQRGVDELKRQAQEAAEFIADQEAQEEARVLAQEKSELQKRLLERAKFELEVKEQIRDRVISEDEANELILQSQIGSLQDQLQQLNISAQERVDLRTRLVELETQVEENALKEQAERRRGYLQLAETLAQIVTDSIIGQRQKELEFEINSLDEQISKQEEAVQKAREVADRGNAEELQAEEDRLTQLNQQREASVARQQRLAATQIKIANAVAIAKQIEGISNAIAQPFPFNLIAIAATVAAIVANIQAIRNANAAASDLQSFSEGTEYTSAKGEARTDDGGWTAILHDGERVVPAKQNAALRGIKNTELPEMAEIYRAHLAGELSPVHAIAPVPVASVASAMNDKKLDMLGQKLDIVAKAASKRDVRVNIDKLGFAMSVQRAVNRKNKMKNRI